MLFKDALKMRYSSPDSSCFQRPASWRKISFSSSSSFCSCRHSVTNCLGAETSRGRRGNRLGGARKSFKT